MYCTAASPRDTWAVFNQFRTPLLVSLHVSDGGNTQHQSCGSSTGCRFVSVWCSSWRRWSTARLQELQRPSCPTSVTSLYLLEYNLFAQLTQDMYTSTRTKWLRRSLFCHCQLIWGTICRCSFENRTFCLTILKLYWRRFFRWWKSRRPETRLRVKSVV